ASSVPPVKCSDPPLGLGASGDCARADVANDRHNAHTTSEKPIHCDLIIGPPGTSWPQRSEWSTVSRDEGLRERDAVIHEQRLVVRVVSRIVVVGVIADAVADIQQTVAWQRH